VDGRRVVVDVIAGSSAGGLTGALLATAIARGIVDNAPFGPVLDRMQRAVLRSENVEPAEVIEKLAVLRLWLHRPVSRRLRAWTRR
jgi:hypothetical protein